MEALKETYAYAIDKDLSVYLRPLKQMEAEAQRAYILFCSGTCSIICIPYVITNNGLPFSEVFWFGGLILWSV